MMAVSCRIFAYSLLFMPSCLAGGGAEGQLLAAVESSDYGALKEALDYGASANTRGFQGNTALCCVAENGKVALVQLLIDSGADVDGRGFFKTTPLINAARNGHSPVVEVLLVNKAQVNAQDASGLTPLHHAIFQRRDSVVQLLLAHRASLFIKDIVGSMPSDYVSSNPKREIIQLVLKRLEADKILQERKACLLEYVIKKVKKTDTIITEKTNLISRLPDDIITVIIAFSTPRDYAALITKFQQLMIARK